MWQTIKSIHHARNVLVICGVLWLTGCSGGDFMQKHRNAYLASYNGPKLVTPDHVNDENISDYHVLPTLSGYPGITPLPPGSELVNTVEQQPIIAPELPASAVKFTEREGEQVLLITIEAPHAWSTVPSALQRQRLSIIDNNQNELYYIFAEGRNMTAETVTANTPLYKLHLRPYKDNTILMVTDIHNQALPQEKADQLLQTVDKGLRGKSNTSALWTLGGLLSDDKA